MSAFPYQPLSTLHPKVVLYKNCWGILRREKTAIDPKEWCAVVYLASPFRIMPLFSLSGVSNLSAICWSVLLASVILNLTPIKIFSWEVAQAS